MIKKKTNQSVARVGSKKSMGNLNTLLIIVAAIGILFEVVTCALFGPLVNVLVWAIIIFAIACVVIYLMLIGLAVFGIIKLNGKYKVSPISLLITSIVSAVYMIYWVIAIWTTPLNFNF